MYILGVRIDEENKNSTLKKVDDFLSSQSPAMIFTPNPEMLVAASREPYFQDVLNAGGLNVCDGKGIELMSFGKVRRYPGVDFMRDICGLAEQKRKKVYLLGSGFKEVVVAAAENLKKQFPELQIVGFHKGPKVTLKREGDITKVVADEEKNDHVLHDIILSAPDVLFVAFGHEKQEKWIYEHLPMLPSVKIAMGVGGSFDFISGKISRAPRFLRRLGLEWVWRLIQEPRRLKRIWNAVIVFPYLCLRDRTRI